MMTARKRPRIPRPAPSAKTPVSPGTISIPAGDLLGHHAAHLKLNLVKEAGRGLHRLITGPRIQKPGLALAGYTEYIHPGRVQILGASEIMFLGGLRAAQRRRALAGLLRAPDIACIIVTTGHQPPEELLRGCMDQQIPLFLTPLTSAQCIERVSAYLNQRLAPVKSIHGDLLDVFGLGVLIIGDSGIGKSECALDLVVRGHRLVADDVVEIRREQSGVLTGFAPELIQYHMELRGIGLINIRDMFGISAISPMKPIDLVVHLEIWVEGKAYDRLGLDDTTHSILDVDLPMVRMPVAPGRNLAILIEVATRNQLLKRRGYHPARRFSRRLRNRLSGGGGK